MDSKKNDKKTPNNKTDKQNDPTATESALKFPCLFPVKIMGLNKPELEKLVLDIFKKHLPSKDHKTLEVKTHLSKHKNYLSITIKFMAKSKKQLDSIYMDLSKHCTKDEDSIIKMIL